MQEIQYVGERIWAGQLGHFFISLSFTAAFLSFVSFFLAAKNRVFIGIARLSFYAHALAVIGIAGGEDKFPVG